MQQPEQLKIPYEKGKKADDEKDDLDENQKIFS